MPVRVALTFGSIRFAIASDLPWPPARALAASDVAGAEDGDAIALTIALDERAGHDGGLTWTGRSYVGPGFDVRVDRGTGPASGAASGRDSYAARVSAPASVAGALAAVLVDLQRTRPILVLHAATLRFGERAVVVVGPSGSGKSSLARRHRARALGSNVALVTEGASDPPFVSARPTVVALPLTGKGDDGVVGGTFPLLGALVLTGGAVDGDARPVSPVSRLLTGVALARHAPADVVEVVLERVRRVTSACPVRIRRHG
ncbi:MAG: hypothetical protein U0169_02890 [Polyangiaceae bacterium]